MNKHVEYFYKQVGRRLVPSLGLGGALDQEVRHSRPNWIFGHLDRGLGLSVVQLDHDIEIIREINN